jgi:hypothetical protein
MPSPSPLRKFSGRTAGWWLSLLLLACAEGRGFAQDEPPPPPSGGGVVLQEDTSGHYFEWVLAAIGVGVATFAVCRSSRRN